MEPGCIQISVHYRQTDAAPPPISSVTLTPLRVSAVVKNLLPNLLCSELLLPEPLSMRVQEAAQLSLVGYRKTPYGPTQIDIPLPAWQPIAGRCYRLVILAENGHLTTQLSEMDSTLFHTLSGLDALVLKYLLTITSS